MFNFSVKDNKNVKKNIKEFSLHVKFAEYAEFMF